MASEPAKLRLALSAPIKTIIEMPLSRPVRVVRLPLVVVGEHMRDVIMMWANLRSMTILREAEDNYGGVELRSSTPLSGSLLCSRAWLIASFRSVITGLISAL